MTERRWFVKYQNVLKVSYAIVHGYPDFEWPREMINPIYKEEIPKEWWGFSIQTYIDFFEHNVKPRVRVRNEEISES